MLSYISKARSDSGMFNAEVKARNLNIYTYNKGKVKKIWSTSDQIIAYNKKQKTIAGLQYSVLSENGSEREKYYIYKYNGKKIVKKASYFFEREGHFEDEDGNKVTTNLEKSEKTVHRVIDKEIYSKKESWHIFQKNNIEVQRKMMYVYGHIIIQQKKSWSKN